MLDLTLIPAIKTTLPPVFEARHLIDGAWQYSTDGATTERLSPSHGTVVSRAAKGGKGEAEAAIAAARTAFAESYKRATFGREEKQAFGQLDRFVADHRTLYR